MKFMEKYFNTLVALVATFFTYIFGSWDLALQVLIVFMVLDYGTGVLYAYLIGQLSSEVGFKGLVKKCMILVVLVIGVMLDRILGTGNWVFRTLVAYFYIANEGISLLENVGNIGIPIPNKLRNALEQLNKDEDPNDEGYLVKYSNDYESWSPKKPFDESYREYDANALPQTAINMISNDYKERFKAEYNQLVIRYNGLNRMIENWDKGCLSFKPTCPRSTYDLQLKAMKDYIAVLEARAIMENIDL